MAADVPARPLDRAPVDLAGVRFRFERIPAVAWFVLIAGLARLAFGPGVLGYDAAWALIWGDQIASGETPDMRTAVAPTPHPLANGVSVAVSVLGPETAAPVMLALSWLSLGALAVAIARLGATLWSWPVGVLAAAIIVSRPLMLTLTAQALVDIPFLALIVWAASAELRRPRQGLAVPALLMLAGLLRPEAWLLAAAYAVWALPRMPGRQRARVAVLLAAAPVLWALTDLWATGDALHSLHGTQALAEELGRPRGPESAITTVPSYLVSSLSLTVVCASGVGAAMALRGRWRSARVPAALLLLGVGAFLVLGFVGLPLRVRYLLVPSTMLALFASVAALGWTRLPGSDPRRRTWQLGGLLAAVLLLLGAPSDARKVRDMRDHMAVRHSVQEELRVAATAPQTALALAHCRHIRVPDYRVRPALSLSLGGPESRIAAAPPGPGDATLVFAFADEAGARHFSAAVPAPPSGRTALPRGSRPIWSGERWLVAAVGC
jgi:4-amino-4-deoxy-L-arabinose transferase-like glycosyltransferase